MPTYDYVCQDCSHAFEHFQTMSSDPLSVCPQCKGKLKRLIGAGAALIFKGTGFYCTDYKKAGTDDKGSKDGKPVKESTTPAAAPPPAAPSSSSSSTSTPAT
jgi:putative FmdB family regulatory protein